LIKDCASALLLFGAGFLGMNDGIHMADAGLFGCVVDIDFPKLEHMSRLYPSDWMFCQADAWDFAGRCDTKFDVVSVDNFTGSAELPVLESLPLWCALATKLVTVTRTTKAHKFTIPLGWEPSIVERSSRANWLVLERTS